MTFFNEYIENIRLFKRDIRLFLLSNLFLGLGSAFFAVLLNLLFDSLGFSKTTIGDIQGAWAVGMAVCVVPVAQLYGRIKTKTLLAASMAVCVLSLTVLVSARTVSVLWWAGVVQGAAFAVHVVAAGPFLMRHTGSKERVHAFGLSFATEVVAGIVGALSAGWVSHWTGIRPALLLGVLLVALSIFPYLAMSEEREGSPVPARRPLGELLKGENLTHYLKIIVPDAVIGVGAGITIPFLNLYLKDRFHFETTGVGTAFAASNAFMVIGIVLSPTLGKKFGLMRTVAATQILSIPFMAVLALTFDARLAFLALMLRSALMNMGHPLARTFQMEIVEEGERATMNSLASLGWNGAWILGTTLGGRLIGQYGFTTSILCTCGIYLISTLLYLRFWSKPEFLKIGRAEGELSEGTLAQASG